MLLRDELKKLVEMQTIDAQIYKLRETKDVSKPDELAAVTAELNEKKQSLKNTEEKLKRAMLTKKERELELATKEDGVKKSQLQLYQLKSNKDYQIKLSEIASLKADVSLFEEEVLKSIDIIEAVEAELKAAKETFAQEEKRIVALQDEISNEIKDLAGQLQVFDDKHTILARDVDPQLLAQYDNLLNKRSGIAITKVAGDCCGYCHMRVTHQIINEIKMYKELVFCACCNRILYIDEDLENG